MAEPATSKLEVIGSGFRRGEGKRGMQLSRRRYVLRMLGRGLTLLTLVNWDRRAHAAPEQSSQQTVAFEWQTPAAQVSIVRSNLTYKGGETPSGNATPSQQRSLASILAAGFVVTPQPEYSYPVESVAFSPDGRQALTGSRDKTARLWDVASGASKLTMYGLGSASALALDGNGLPVTVTGPDDDAYIFVRGSEIRRPSDLRREGYDLPLSEDASYPTAR